MKRLTFRVRNADVTYHADVTLSLRATSGGLFSFCRLLALYCFKTYFASLSRYKIMFLPNIMHLNMLNKTKLVRNG